ncbi:MAG TPA: diguanylate cyclase, partial [Noviherbaspirillum sp.]
LKRNQTILKEQAKNYRQLVELSPQATLVCQESKIVLLNLAASRLLGAHSPADLLGENIMDFVDNADHVSLHELGELSGQGSHSPAFVEQVWHRKDGDRFHAEVGATNLMYNEMPSLQLIVRDITARKRKEKIQLGQTDILNSVATGAPLASILSDIAQFAEEHSNDGLCAIHQLGSDDATLTQCIAPGTQERFIPVLGDEKIGPTSGSCGTAAFRGTPVVVQDIKCDPLWDAKRDVALSLGLNACVSWPVLGKSRKVLGTISLFYREATRPSDADMELLRICANLAGIAIDSRASEERIRYLAHYDGLTSLPNRFMFKEYLDLALRNAQRHRKKFAVLFLDLDKFKQINDTLGHDAGDMVLREMARRLRGCLRHNDKIARMGGDEFYVLIEDLNDGHDAAEVAQKLLDEAIRPIYVGDNECQLSVSIGISIYPDDGSDGEKLLCNADKAMYRTKENGKNGFHFFSMQKAYSRPELPLISPSLLRDNSRVHLV